MKMKPTTVLDILGISSATICLIHCILLPMLTILPVQIFDNHFIDLAFACIGLFVFSKIILSDANISVKIILGLSIITVVVGVSLEILFGGDFYFIVIGGIGMIIGHVLNFVNHRI